MITRKQYMERTALHHQYYLEIAREAGISYANSPELPRIKEALASGDQHLNSIPLYQWDGRAEFTRRAISKAMKERGDFYSLAGGVCAHKAAAREDAGL